MHSLVAHSGLHRTILYVAIVVWAGPEWVGSFFQRSKEGAAHHDGGSLALLMVSFMVGIVAAFVFVNIVPEATLDWHEPLLFWIGIVLMLVGVVIRWHAIRVLGPFFTRDVATRADQVVVERGPYRLIRHPSYSGGLLSLLGLGLALTNWLSLAVLLIFPLIGYSYRVRVEEQALCNALGQPYREYMARTCRFIPYVW